MKRQSETGSLSLPGVLLLAVLVMSWPAAGQQAETQEFKSSGVLVERVNELFTLRDYRGLEFTVEVNSRQALDGRKRRPRHHLRGRLRQELSRLRIRLA